MKMFFLTITLKKSDGSRTAENVDITANSFVNALKKYELHILPEDCEIIAAAER